MNKLNNKTQYQHARFPGLDDLTDKVLKNKTATLSTLILSLKKTFRSNTFKASWSLQKVWSVMCSIKRKLSSLYICAYIFYMYIFDGQVTLVLVFCIKISYGKVNK